MAVTTDGQGNHFIGNINAGVGLSTLWASQGSGEIYTLFNNAGIRSQFLLWSGALVLSWTAPTGVGGEINTNGPTPQDVSSTFDPQTTIVNNSRFNVFLWSVNDATTRCPGNINSGDSDSQEVIVPISAKNVPINKTGALKANASARFWVTVSQQRYITFFCYVDASNYYSIEMGYTNEVSGVVFPLNCIVKYTIMYQGAESWYAGVPTGVGLTTVTAIPQTGSRSNYAHLTSAYISKDATNLFAVTSTGGIGRCGTNLKITRINSLYSSLGIRSKFSTDSDVLSSPRRNYHVIGKSGVSDSELKMLMRFNGTGTVTSATIIDEMRNRVWLFNTSPSTPFYSNSIFKFGTSSICLTAGVVSYTSPSDMLVGSSNFTIQFWLYPASASFASQNLINYDQYAVSLSSTQLDFTDYSGSGQGTKSFTFSQGTILSSQFNHIAISRNGTNFRCFINGNQVGSTLTLNALSTPALTYFMINGNGWYMDSFSVHIGANSGLYTANFTPPTLGLPALPELIAMHTY